MPIPVVFRASSPDGNLESFGINQETTVTATTTVTVAASNDLFMTVSTYSFFFGQLPVKKMMYRSFHGKPAKNGTIREKKISNPTLAPPVKG
jgi:hypothetical protein